MKRCCTCKKMKPLSEFHNSRCRFDGKHRQCKECCKTSKAKSSVKRNGYSEKYNVNVAMRNRLMQLVGHAGENERRQKYGLSALDFIRMKESQGNVCAICKKPESRRDFRTGRVLELTVDHDHITGEVRGLLCSYCNKLLGNVEKGDWLKRAIEYLKKGVEKSSCVKLISKV